MPVQAIGSAPPELAHGDGSDVAAVRARFGDGMSGFGFGGDESGTAGLLPRTIVGLRVVNSRAGGKIRNRY